jgi:hypothetical protein
MGKTGITSYKRNWAARIALQIISDSGEDPEGV